MTWRGVTADSNTTAYTYFKNGSRESITYQNGASEHYTYYANSLLWTLTNKDLSQSTMDVYTYTYDDAGNQLSKTETINGVSKGTTVFTYDALNRLKAVTEPSGKMTSYTFDKAGDRERADYGDQIHMQRAEQACDHSCGRSRAEDHNQVYA